MEQERTSFSIAWFLLFALVCHLFLSPLPVPRGYRYASDDSKKDEPIVVENWNRDRPIVRSEKSIDDPKAKDKTARYYGEFRNRVEQETHAPNTGRFTPGAGQLGKGGEKSKGRKGDPDEDSLGPSVEGDGRLPGGPNLSDLLQPPSSPYKFPDDVKKGNSTMLNTDPVMYASFVNRIADAIYDPWKNRAMEALYVHKNMGNPLTSKTYSTVISVLLKSSGEITSIQILQSCGIDLLDEAPRRAFWEQKAFPNPPHQLADEKGFIKFVYTFEFEVNKNFFSVSPGLI